MTINSNPRIDPTAEVSPGARVGDGTSIWNYARVREGAVVGENCILGSNVYIDCDVPIGDNVKIQNGALIYKGAALEDGVFIGPHACLTNDRLPRAINPDGRIKTEEDWKIGQILIRYGASIGAGAVILPGVTIGRYAMVGAGAVVSREVPDHGLVVGIPARLVGHVCRCGERLESFAGGWRCRSCKSLFEQAAEGMVPKAVQS